MKINSKLRKRLGVVNPNIFTHAYGGDLTLIDLPKPNKVRYRFAPGGTLPGDVDIPNDTTARLWKYYNTKVGQNFIEGVDAKVPDANIDYYAKYLDPNYKFNYSNQEYQDILKMQKSLGGGYDAVNNASTLFNTVGDISAFAGNMIGTAFGVPGVGALPGTAIKIAGSLATGGANSMLEGVNTFADNYITNYNNYQTKYQSDKEAMKLNKPVNLPSLFKCGGRIKRHALGGELVPVTSDTLKVTGRTHRNGGVVDTEGITGTPGANEFENNEFIQFDNNGNGKVFSDKLGTADKVAPLVQRKAAIEAQLRPLEEQNAQLTSSLGETADRFKRESIGRTLEQNVGEITKLQNELQQLDAVINQVFNAQEGTKDAMGIPDASQMKYGGRIRKYWAGDMLNNDPETDPYRTKYVTDVLNDLEWNNPDLTSKNVTDFLAPTITNRYSNWTDYASKFNPVATSPDLSKFGITTTSPNLFTIKNSNVVPYISTPSDTPTAAPSVTSTTKGESMPINWDRVGAYAAEAAPYAMVLADNIGNSIINRRLKKMTLPKHEKLMPANLPTSYDISGQLANISAANKSYTNMLNSTMGNTNVMLARAQGQKLIGMEAENALQTNKINQETTMKTRKLLNEQEVARLNADNEYADKALEYQRDIQANITNPSQNLTNLSTDATWAADRLATKSYQQKYLDMLGKQTNEAGVMADLLTVDSNKSLFQTNNTYAQEQYDYWMAKYRTDKSTKYLDAANKIKDWNPTVKTK